MNSYREAEKVNIMFGIEISGVYKFLRLKINQ